MPSAAAGPRTGRTRADRRSAIGDAAIDLLAQQGMRGLTHRAVDAAAGLPAGSTSYYARTREALLGLVMARMVELDLADIAAATDRVPFDPTDLDAVAERMAEQIVATVRHNRVRMTARYEFALEATRRPELRKVYDEAGARMRAPAVDLLRAAGSADPRRHGRSLISWYEGIVFDSIAGAGGARPPGRAELRTSAREILRGMLGR